MLYKQFPFLIFRELRKLIVESILSMELWTISKNTSENFETTAESYYEYILYIRLYYKYKRICLYYKYSVYVLYYKYKHVCIII